MNKTDCFLLQTDINNLRKWYEANEFNFNVSKCLRILYYKTKN